jgi:guanine deaminase
MKTVSEQLKQLAEQNLQEGGSPYSALVVLHDEVIATGVNQAHRTNDPTQHAELLAIQQALTKISLEEMKEAILYASGEPCPMCKAAAAYVQVKQIYYAVSRDEINALGKLPKNQNVQEVKLPASTVYDCFRMWQPNEGL